MGAVRPARRNPERKDRAAVVVDRRHLVWVETQKLVHNICI
jgi:hypothetical protein